MMYRTAALALVLTAAQTAAHAQVSCDSVSFSDVGWTDITTTTSAAKQVLTALGYKVDVRVLSVPVTFQSLADGDTDVFLGNWMPSQTSAIQPYLDKGTITTLDTNLNGTVYNLAVPAYTYDKGLKTYADIAKFGKSLDDKIYGIEPGNEANTYLDGLIKKDDDGLGDFKVVESSEQGMLAQVRRLYKRKEDVVFLGWAPHPMNNEFDLKYLKGGEDFFGTEGVVNTVTRKGFAEACPNAGKLVAQMKFTMPMENTIMGKILDDKEDADKAVKEWIAANPAILDGWLDGVTTHDGQPGLPAVKAAFGL